MSHPRWDAPSATTRESPDVRTRSAQPSGGSSANRTPARLVTAHLARPLALGFTVTLGGLLAVALALAFRNLSSILISITLALFIALGLDPIVRALERRGLSRPVALAIVSVAAVVLFLAVLGLLLPIVARQLVALLRNIPAYFDAIMGSAGYRWLDDNLGDGLTSLTTELEALILSPATIAAIGGGVLQAGAGLLGGVVSGIVVFVLTLYFTASLGSMKQAFYRLTPAWSRPQVAGLTERITRSVGAYLKGMVVLAFLNAVFVLVAHGVLGLPFGALMAVAAFFITLIPLIGTATFWVLGTLLALLTGPGTAFAFAVVYAIYMEIEAYVLTPRVMRRAVQVPGALVVIGALIGGTLLGFLGALVAIPVTASILLITREVVLPRQDAKTEPGPV